MMHVQIPEPSAASRRRPRASVFSPQQLRIVTLLYERRYGAPVTRCEIEDALYRDDPRGGVLDTSGVIERQLFHARAKLRPMGCAIANEWGRGYRLVRLPA